MVPTRLRHLCLQLFEHGILPNEHMPTVFAVTEYQSRDVCTLQAGAQRNPRAYLPVMVYTCEKSKSKSRSYRF